MRRIVTVMQLVREDRAKLNREARERRSRRREVGTKSEHTLFVGNLAYTATEDDLQDLVKQVGCLPRAVRIATDRETRKPRGFAFIEFATREQATEAMAQLDSVEFLGRQVRVRFAPDRAEGRR